MSDVINGIYARSTNDTPQAGGYAAAPATAEPDAIEFDTADVADDAIEADEIKTVEPTGGAAETEEAAGDSDLVVETVGDDEAETASDADAVVETAEADPTEGDQTEEDHENTLDAETAEVDTADDQADDDGIVEGDPAVEIAAGVSDEAATDEDAAEVAEEVADEEAGIAQDVESLAGESDDASVAAAAETDEDDIEEVEPGVTEARPAAGTRGSTTVGDGVVAKVVNMVVRKVEGVHDLGDEGISVGLDGEVATIGVSLVVEFGHAVQALAEQIRIDVIEAVEQFLSLDVAVVDVHVADIHLPDAD